MFISGRYCEQKIHKFVLKKKKYKRIINRSMLSLSYKKIVTKKKKQTNIKRVEKLQEKKIIKKKLNNL